MRATQLKQDGSKTKDSGGTGENRGLAGTEPRLWGTHTVLALSAPKKESTGNCCVQKTEGLLGKTSFPGHAP